MATLTIHSRLKHFKLVARITHVSASVICAEAGLDGMPMYAGLETMAQLAALHVRYCLEFQRHAFLLKVNQGFWPAKDCLAGCYGLTAERYSQSSKAFAYQVKAQGPTGAMSTADLLIGTVAYDNEFQEDILTAYYREVFGKLRSEIGE